MIIFPLSPAARVVFILVAAVLGLIFSMVMWPAWWKKKLGKKDKPNGAEHAKVDKAKLKEFMKDRE